MYISVTGCPDNNFRPWVKKAVTFYGESLIPNKNLRNHIGLLVRFSDKLEEQAFSSIDGYTVSGKPREFLIEIHSGLGAPETLKTLAHEMVHIKQYVNRELSDYWPKKTKRTSKVTERWKGKNYNSDKMDYYSFPWEIEAYGREEGLYRNFMHKEKLWKIFRGISNPKTNVLNTPIKWK